MKRISITAIIALLTLLAAASVAIASPDLTGKVVETMDSGGYTYVLIKNNGKETWFAIPLAKVKKGSTVTFLPGGAMPNFTSKTLGKTFDVIIFSPGLAK